MQYYLMIVDVLDQFLPFEDSVQYTKWIRGRFEISERLYLDIIELGFMNEFVLDRKTMLKEFVDQFEMPDVDLLLVRMYPTGNDVDLWIRDTSAVNATHLFSTKPNEELF